MTRPPPEPHLSPDGTGLRVDRDGAVLHLRLDRPERRNPLTGSLRQALADALEPLGAAGEPRVALLSSLQGEAAVFAAGADLTDIAALEAREAPAFAEEGQALMRRIEDLPGVVRTADIVIAAVGRPNMVRGDWVKPGAVVIDVGINRVEKEIDGELKSKLTGDVDYDEVAEVAAAVTPVPGGVGPMTITMLMFNTLRSARLAAGLSARRRRGAGAGGGRRRRRDGVRRRAGRDGERPH